MTLVQDWNMRDDTKLLWIKLLHTIIWLFFVVVIAYIIYSGVIDKITIYTWISVGLVLLEGLILLVFRSYCPLTLVARKYSHSRMDNFDIFIPNWLARNNKVIFTSLFIMGLIFVLYRIVF